MGEEQTAAPDLLEILNRLEAQLALLSQSIAEVRRSATRTAKISFVPLKVAAGRTGFSAECVRLWVLRGQIKGERRGGRWFVDPSSVAERIRRRSSAAA